jgi:hypothetical protein
MAAARAGTIGGFLIVKWLAERFGPPGRAGVENSSKLFLKPVDRYGFVPYFPQVRLGRKNEKTSALSFFEGKGRGDGFLSFCRYQD